MATYSNWQLSNAAIEYEPKETIVSETVSVFTSGKQGIVPPSDNKSTNTGQYILAANGTWIPQPAFTSGGSDAFETLRPSNFSTTYSIFPPTPVNSSYAFDVDDNHATTFGEWEFVFKNRNTGLTDIFIFNTWAAKGQTWTAATINVSRSYGYFNDGESNATTGSNNRISSVLIQYSVDNGSNWYTIATDLSASTPLAATTSSAALPSLNPTMGSVLLKFTVYRGGGGMVYDPDIGISIPGTTGDMDLKIYDVWISGTYAGGAGNITCNNLAVTGDATFSGKIKDGTGSAGTSGYVLSSTGTQTLWVPDSVGSGTVTSITTTGANGVTISGGSTQTITTSGTFALALGNITPTSIVTGTGSFSGDVEFSSSIKSPNGSNSPVTIAPDGTGDLHVNADSMRLGDNNADATIATRGTGDLILTTHEGSAVEGIVRLYDGANGNITLTPNGTGQVQVGTDQVVTLAASQTLTNKSISGSTNTLSNIANASTTATSANTASAIVARDGSGNFSAGTITANLTGNASGSSGSTTGNAATATALQTARAINGVNFDGTAAITVTAAAGTLTGATLASGVTASSLTSVGTLTGLTVSGLTTVTNANILLSNAYNLSARNAANTLSLALIGRNSSDKVAIDPDGYGVTMGGPLTVSGTTSLATSSGFSQIGTASNYTSSKLQVYGNIDLVNTSTSQFIRFYDGTTFKGGLGTDDWVGGSSANLTLVSNGDSVFRTTGSATERMRIVGSSGNVGIGTASPSTKLHVSNAGVSAQATFVGTTGSPYITVVGNSGTTILGNESNGGWVGTTGSQSFVFKTTDIERVRIDSSGNVGIGTASPSYRLHVSASDTSNVVGGSAAAINISNSNAAAFSRTVDLNFSVGGGASAERIAGLSAVYTSYGTSVGGALAFCTNNGSSSFAERMRIDSSGNVGIGVTPSAWGSAWKGFQVQQYTVAALGSDEADINLNAYNDNNGWRYISTNFATQYRQGSGIHIWYTAPSGTAGNSITFTERMRIDTTQVKATVPFIGNSGTKGFGGITTTTSTSTPTGGSSGDHYYIY